MKLRSLLTASSLILVGAGLYFAPKSVVEGLRGPVTDLLQPGQRLLYIASENLAPELRNGRPTGSTADSQNVAQLQAELDVERERGRAYRIRLAQLTDQLLAEEQISPGMKKPQRLIIPQLIEVAVLGDSIAEQWRAGKMLDQGSKNGLRENELIISTKKPLKPLIDFGEDADLSAEDAILLGRCVIGKVERVGRWTSTFQLVTDAQYRGRAQLIRETSDGRFVFESQGLLKGQGGPLCKLEGIPAEKSVRVNDAVYTADRDGIRSTPLYYGQVVEAKLEEPDGREWTILVKPASLPSHLTTVHVLRTAVNPDRLAEK